MGCTSNQCAASDGLPCVGTIKNYKIDGGRWVPLEFADYCDKAVERIRGMGWKLTEMGVISQSNKTHNG